MYTANYFICLVQRCNSHYLRLVIYLTCTYLLLLIFRKKKLSVSFISIRIPHFILFQIFRAVNAFVYYGLSVNSTSMSGDKYLNFALVSLIEIPGYTLAWVSIRHCGRRISLVGSLLLCGLTCGLTIWLPPGNLFIYLRFSS